MTQVLLEVLNARLADIREWWTTGALQARGFGAPQVAHLVRALFEPTEMRAQVMSRTVGVSGAVTWFSFGRIRSRTSSARCSSRQKCAPKCKLHWHSDTFAYCLS